MATHSNQQKYEDKVYQLYVFLLSSITDPNEIYTQFNRSNVLHRDVTLEEFNLMAIEINHDLKANERLRTLISTNTSFA